MRSILLLVFITFAFTNDETFKKLTALNGLWKMETSKGRLYESWKVVNEAKLNGSSYRLSGTDTIPLENMELAVIGKSVFYIPTVADENNSEPTRFKLIGLADNTYTFENKQHDFPQRIIYKFVNNDSIVARIEGKVKDKFRFSNFYYSRVK